MFESRDVPEVATHPVVASLHAAAVEPAGELRSADPIAARTSFVELALASVMLKALEVTNAVHHHHPDATDARVTRSAQQGGLSSRASGGSSADEAVLDVVRRLVGADVSSMSDDALVDAVVAWQQVASWAAAEQARVVGELLARGGSSSQAADAVVHELTAALVTSRRTATALVGRATGLGRAPEVADALAEGRIDAARADVLVCYDAVPAAVRERVAGELVGTAAAPGPATGLTPAQLRDRLRRAAIEADPDGAVERAAAAAERRHVWIDPAPDQMAWLTALLPAADAARVWARLDAASRERVRAAGETRTVAQVRADTLTDLVTEGSAPAAGVRTVVNVTVAASTLLGLDESPADLAGYGPVPATVARVLASDGDPTWRRILTDPVTGAATDVSRTGYRPGVVLGDLVRTRDTTCTFPGCQVPATRCDLDHVDPFDPRRSTPGQTRADNLHPVCRAHHNAKTHGGWSTHRDPGSGAITWTAPSGHRYTVPARPTDPTLPTAPTLRGRRPASRGHDVDPGDDGDPPF
ncbi:uncharacterized protein KDY119_01200 [Luteimicrobium xylanilyticum]|uniref:DUF222 domain-containing protein n=2 Tax=Luteimicrobium xylanilyticum TaxID=1133546 RepID=A0A5P9Q8E3_9MICO|nr:HNH endonuclease signature motif containing protein [Luteimicrobium xylanilyticum]QFU97701.1 uncharacterized protein KDY119_01200 [Luteimicrobium xylanilyticum]